MICSPYAGAMTKIVWNSMEPFTPFMALEMRFCQIPNGKTTEKNDDMAVVFPFFSHALLKEECLGYTLFISVSFSSIQSVLHGLLKHKCTFPLKRLVFTP